MIDVEIEVIVREGPNFCWTLYSLLVSVLVTEFRRTKRYSSLDVGKVKYDTCKHSRGEKEMLQC
jgi:hypothetical protein